MGVDYIVDSRAEWISDGTSTDCTADGKAADYIKITTMVSPTNIPACKPVTVTSTSPRHRAPSWPRQGSLAVTVVDATAPASPTSR